MNNATKVVLVDDHVLLRNGLAALVTSLGYTVMYECSNGKDLIEKLDKNDTPDLILMDISMPEMDGFDTTLWLKRNRPHINVLALSMYDNETSIIRMIKNGARGYILKDSDPVELKQAINSVVTKGFYYSDLVSGRLVRAIRDDEDDEYDNKRAVLGLNETIYNYTYKPFVDNSLENRTWLDKMYFRPISRDEVNKNNKLIQNPGYE